MELARRVDFRKPGHRFGVARAGLGALLFLMLACAAVGAEPGSTMPLRIGVYQVAPYGGQSSAGVVVGASLPPLRPVPGPLHLPDPLMPVSPMRALPSGRANGARPGAG